MVGFWSTETICAAVELGVMDALPGVLEKLSARCGVAPSRMNRLLRALGELQLVTKDGPQWHATAKGCFLAKNHPQSLADAAVEYARHFRAAWQQLPDAMRNDGAWRTPDIFGHQSL